MGMCRQVGDLPRISVAEPLQQSEVRRKAALSQVIPPSLG